MDDPLKVPESGQLPELSAEDVFQCLDALSHQQCSSEELTAEDVAQYFEALSHQQCSSKELSAEDVAQYFEALRHQQSRNDPPSSRLVQGYNVPGPVGNVSSDTGDNIPQMIQLQSQTRQQRHPSEGRSLKQAHSAQLLSTHSAQGVSTQASPFAATGVSLQQAHSLQKSHIQPGYSSSLQKCSGQLHSAKGVSTQAGPFAATAVSLQQAHSLQKSHIQPGYSSSLQKCSGQLHSAQEVSTQAGPFAATGVALQQAHSLQKSHIQPGYSSSLKKCSGQLHSAQGVSTQAGPFTATTGVSLQQAHSLQKSHNQPGYSSSLKKCSGQQGHSSNDASTDGASNRSGSNPDQTGHSSSLLQQLLQSGQKRQHTVCVNRICEVCGHEPTKMQRDACICEVCRYFFHHIVSNKNQFKPCSRQFECDLSSREGTCTYCRYVKCLEMGIKPQLNQRDVPEFLAIAEIVTEAHTRRFRSQLVSPAILLSIAGKCAKHELAVMKKWATIVQGLADLPKDDLNLLLEAAYFNLIIAGISYRSTGVIGKTIMFANGCVVHQYAVNMWGARAVEYSHGFHTVKEISDKMATLKVTREEMGCLRAILFFNHGLFLATSKLDIYDRVNQLYTRCHEALVLSSHFEPKRHESLVGLIENIKDAGVKWFKYLATHGKERALLNKVAPELLRTMEMYVKLGMNK